MYFGFPEEVEDIISSYYNPYKTYMDNVIFEISNFENYEDRYRYMYKDYIRYLLEPYEIPMIG